MDEVGLGEGLREGAQGGAPREGGQEEVGAEACWPLGSGKGSGAWVVLLTSFAFLCVCV